LPSGYTTMGILSGKEWMSVTPKSLGVGGSLTQWPGMAAPCIAMVDTGGGPIFLSDPNGYVYGGNWPQAVSCPTWSSTSASCNCVASPISIQLTDGVNSFSYTVDTGSLPAPVQGLTAVMCQTNTYMMGQYGMNIGGISALFNAILIDYSGKRVGFKPR
jgi:hypothetical protein